jgi:dihydrolipoamide dehydrogenase
MADMRGQPRPADYRAIPRVIFTDPEVAAVGQTEAQASADGGNVAVSRVKLLQTIARPYTYEQNPRGELTVIADRDRGVLVGAWAVAPLASEWIHQAVLAIRAQVAIDVLLDTVAQFPSYSEAYLSALAQLEL